MHHVVAHPTYDSAHEYTYQGPSYLIRNKSLLSRTYNLPINVYSTLRGSLTDSLSVRQTWRRRGEQLANPFPLLGLETGYTTPVSTSTR